MGIGSWLKSLIKQGSRNSKGEGADSTAQVSTGTSVRQSEPVGLVVVAGTTTFAKDAVQKLADLNRLADRDILETHAVLRRYPQHANAIAVLVDGVKVGALTNATSQVMKLTLGDEHPVGYQLHVLRTEKKLEALAHVWLGPGVPQWTFTRENPAPLTTAERAAASHKQSSQIVSDGLQNVLRSSEITAGMVKGYHYIELVEPIKQLKRDGRLRDALTLAYVAIAAAENEARNSGREPAPAYTMHAAIIHRKLGQHDEERTVLERWISATPAERRKGSKVAERLGKLNSNARHQR